MFSRAGGQPNALLVLADIKPDRMTLLQQRLDTIRDTLERDHAVYFWNATTVHFAAWIILPALLDKNGKQDGPARLAFETNYDGCCPAHLKDLVDNCKQILDEVYDCCEGYPGVASRTPQSVQDFLCKQSEPAQNSLSSYYVAFQGRTRKDIQNAIDVYKEAKGILEASPRICLPPKSRVSNNKLKSYFQSFFKEDEISANAQEALITHFSNTPKTTPERSPFPQEKLNRRFFWTMIVLLPLSVFFLLYWFVLALIARCFEETEQYGQKRFLPDPTYHPPSFDRLDLGRQNHLCTYATVKPGCFRMWAMKSALYLGQFLFARIFVFAKLDQMTTVHFARWTLLGRQVLFYGSYDGDYSSYLGDFSDQAWGVNLVWSNTFGFPATRFLIRGGGSDLEGFEAHALTHYAPAPVFYSAYREDTVPNILRYLAVRDEIALLVFKRKREEEKKRKLEEEKK
jgi:hypothetical protein